MAGPDGATSVERAEEGLVSVDGSKEGNADPEESVVVARGTKDAEVGMMRKVFHLE